MSRHIRTAAELLERLVREITESLFMSLDPICDRLAFGMIKSAMIIENVENLHQPMLSRSVALHNHSRLICRFCKCLPTQCSAHANTSRSEIDLQLSDNQCARVGSFGGSELACSDAKSRETHLKRKVLFLCETNGVHSPMAEALLNRMDSEH